ncbi:efflux RND transporter periplasmic adaptor subunit [Spirochaeta africana]|uniref:RND family efflux transporter, MFP subunit n=1 Tax=Spirochaeta africana (strain ATCC 700263 / DSM 8902 / Z-7692) TaxID=889378 RepID=H9UMX2_SPIAZ|nr:efflux RND transporter periplasmic adaptor subunit [Spirochaeta africana]AFG38865.1 RND family efflux transporter, MFP subunit [Spirochaeta africana DSM 8902]
MKHPNLPVQGLIPMLTLLSVLLLASCSPENGDDALTGADQEDELTISVTVRELEPQLIRNYIDVNAEIQPVTSVDVFADTAGELTRLTVSKGDRVSRTDVIGEVDPSRAGQRFAPSPIRAPISGTVVMVAPRVGSQISPQTPVARIATTDELEITTHISDRHLGRLRSGTRALVKLDAFPGEEFPARITRLSPVVDPQSRTAETILRFDRTDRRIRPGMFARLQIILEERPDSLAVPQTAIVRRDGRTMVYIIDEDSRAARREVELGIQIDGQAELRSGVQPGDRVITRGQNLVEAGTRVRILED